MNSQTVLAGLLGLGVVGAVVGTSVYFSHQQRLHLTGQILKVRTHPSEPQAVLAILDFRLVNPSKYQFVVKEVLASAELANGQRVEGMTVSEIDARRLFEYYPVLGEKHNPTLVIREKIGPGQTLDRMVAVRFPVSEEALRSRKLLTVRIEDIDEVRAEIH